MHYMHDLKDLLCAELEDYAEKGKKSGKMSMGVSSHDPARGETEEASLPLSPVKTFEAQI